MYICNAVTTIFALENGGLFLNLLVNSLVTSSKALDLWHVILTVIFIAVCKEILAIISKKSSQFHSCIFILWSLVFNEVLESVNNVNGSDLGWGHSIKEIIKYFIMALAQKTLKIKDLLNDMVRLVLLHWFIFFFFFLILFLGNIREFYKPLILFAFQIVSQLFLQI